MFKRMINVFKALHGRCRSCNIEDLVDDQKTPYQKLLGWLLDLLLYGTLTTTVLACFGLWFGWLRELALVLGFGLVWWIIPEFKRNYKEISMRK